MGAGQGKTRRTKAIQTSAQAPVTTWSYSPNNYASFVKSKSLGEDSAGANIGEYYLGVASGARWTRGQQKRILEKLLCDLVTEGVIGLAALPGVKPDVDAFSFNVDFQKSLKIYVSRADNHEDKVLFCHYALSGPGFDLDPRKIIPNWGFEGKDFAALVQVMPGVLTELDELAEAKHNPAQQKPKQAHVEDTSDLVF